MNEFKLPADDTPLGVADVEAAVAHIADRVARDAGDPEFWHADEDTLLQRVIRAIASGNHFDSPADLAAAAAKIYEIHYSRWYS